MDIDNLDGFLQVMPLLKDILQEDILVSVSDREKLLYYRPSKDLDFKAKIGQKISADSPLNKCIKEEKIFNDIVPKEFLGVAFKSIVYPIKNVNGTVIGTVAIGRSLENQFRIEESTDTLFSSLEESNATIEEINAGSEKLLNTIFQVVETVKQTEKNVKESNEIIGMIQNIASQSNLLGLNAAIESARAGESGRGFSIVASEMRKLAKLSGESSKKVSSVLSEISTKINEILSIIKEAQSISEGQSAATQEIAATLEEITASAQIVVEITKVK